MPSGNVYQDVVSKRERIILRDHASLAARRGSQLELKLASGKSKLFTNSAECEGQANCVEYGLYAYDVANRVFVIWAQYWEGHGAIMVDQRYGATLELSDVPHVSPSGAYWLVAAPDFGSGYEDFGVTIVKRNGESFTVRTIGDGDCVFDKWLEEDSFRMYCARIDDGSSDFDEWQETVVQRDEADRWIMRVTGKTLTYEESVRLSDHE